MGGPKHRWAPEEEASLKAGVAKHGVGKWRAILNDPEFGPTLCHRSNVDLKDKWRNMNINAIALGSREKGRAAPKKAQSILNKGNHTKAISKVTSYSNDKTVDEMPIQAAPSEALNTSNPMKPQSRLENIVMEAIKNLSEPMGSTQITIGNYIQEKYSSSSDFDLLLTAKLKDLVTSGKILKVKRKYMIAPILPLSDSHHPKMLLLEDVLKKYSTSAGDDIKALTRSQVDAELALMLTMTPEEAAAAAARAVEEAEAILAEAEAAAAEAEAAEAEAAEHEAAAKAAVEKLNLMKKRNATKSVAKA